MPHRSDGRPGRARARSHSDLQSASALISSKQKIARPEVGKPGPKHQALSSPAPALCFPFQFGQNGRLPQEPRRGVVIWACSQDEGTRGRASRRCTSARKAIPLIIHPSGNYSRVMGVCIDMSGRSCAPPLLSASDQARNPDDVGKEYLYVRCGLSLSLL